MNKFTSNTTFNNTQELIIEGANCASCFGKIEKSSLRKISLKKILLKKNPCICLCAPFWGF